MKIIKPEVELLSITQDAEQLIERAGRTCYKSEGAITETSAPKFVDKIKNQLKHHSVLEHASATIKFVTDRGVTHEMVRHRLAAYSQESTRYCNYGRDKFGAEINVIEPPCKTKKGLELWSFAMVEAEERYLSMLEAGESPQIARSVLPNSLKTEIVMTCNFREWLHVFALRTSPKAHPQIVEIMVEAQKLLVAECPTVFTEQEKA